MLDLSNAIVHDVECFPNCFTLSTEFLFRDDVSTWEISQFRDDRLHLMQFLNWLYSHQIPMIGFNNLSYDYIMLDYLFRNPQVTCADLYRKNQEIFASQNRFGAMIWERDRFAPQIDLFKIHHFDNKAKTTNLKALQINMRSPNVMDCPIEFGVAVTQAEIDKYVIPYNRHDVSETKQFAHYSLPAIQFRIDLIGQLGNHPLEPLNYNDTKIGEKMLEKRLGDAVCYDSSSGRKEKRQTPRHRVALSEIIFPYVQFQEPEFARVLDFMKSQVLTPDDLDDPDKTGTPDVTIRTKGVFKGLVANVAGLEFKFGTGGVHASLSGQKITANDDWHIHDIDVEGLYPRLAIVNRLAPEHLGEAFIAEYAKIPDERKTHLKGTYQNAALKLAGNGAWGKSNSKFSVFFDPKYAMTIPINGQLLICILVEWLKCVPTIQFIQANTDGITYYVHKDHQNAAREIMTMWENYTLLKLEFAQYSHMWIRDVNNYLARSIDGKLKQKGAYWHPDPLDYANSISNASPPCWYKDLGNIVSIRAANAAMLYGIDPETFIRAHSDPYDFCLRIKVDRASILKLGDRVLQRNTRYFVARSGAPMIKVSPPAKGAAVGAYKRRSGLSDSEYERIAATVPPGTWNERIHTKNMSRYEIREMSVEAGWQVCECNDIRNFNFSNVNYDYYVNEAKKLIIGA